MNDLLWPNPLARNTLASGGTGDVLTGLIAGFVAQGLSPFDAACMGVYCHGKAADRLANRWGEQGMLATDLLPEIPIILKSLVEQQIRENV
jgi:NAD(P)H-hydrate epimerase